MSDIRTWIRGLLCHWEFSHSHTHWLLSQVTEMNELDTVWYLHATKVSRCNKIPCINLTANHNHLHESHVSLGRWVWRWVCSFSSNISIVILSLFLSVAEDSHLMWNGAISILRTSWLLSKIIHYWVVRSSRSKSWWTGWSFNVD